MPLRYCLLVYNGQGEMDYSLQRWIGKGTKHAHDEAYAREFFAKDDDITPPGYVWALCSWDGESAKVTELERRTITRWLAAKITMTKRARSLLAGMTHPIGPLLARHASNEFGDFLNITKDGDMEITQMTRDVRREAVYDDVRDTYSGPSRVALKPGRFVRKFLSPSHTESLSDADIEKFSNELRALASANFDEIVIVRGDAIAHWYDEQNYSTTKSIGVLGNSCMRYSTLAKNGTLDIYTKNPDTVGLAILRDMSGKLVARAMVWTDEDGNVIMDRVYGTDVNQARFIKWAQSQGFYTKRSYSSRGYGTGWHYPDGKEYDWTFFVPVPNCDFPKYPHIDTLSYLDLEKKVIHSNETYPYDRALTGTEGRYSNIDRSTQIWNMWRDGKPQPVPCPQCQEMGNPTLFTRLSVIRDGRRVTVSVCRECYYTHEECQSCRCSYWDRAGEEIVKDGRYTYRLCGRCVESIRRTYVQGNHSSSEDALGGRGGWVVDYMNNTIAIASSCYTRAIVDADGNKSLVMYHHSNDTAFLLGHTECMKCMAYVKGRECQRHPKKVRTVEVTWDED